MRSALALGFALWAGAFGLPAAAQEGVACLQAQLTDLGHDPGPVDGTMRPAVRDAAQAWGGGDGFPDLRRRTATSWCREIGIANPDLQTYWPSRAPVTLRAQSPAGEALLRQSVANVRAYFQEQHGIALATRVALVGTSDPAFVNPALQEVLAELGRRPRVRLIDTARLCQGEKVGGAANRGYMLFCWPDALEDTAWQAVTRPELQKVMVHEYTHQVQYALAADDPARRENGAWLLGPHWMIEGMAELIEWQFETGIIDADGTTLFDLQSRARRSRLMLDDLSVLGTVETSEAYGVARFATYLLAQRNGSDALFDYFRAMGRGASQEAAFQSTFGLSLEAYSTLFEDLRRDYGAARRFGREGP
ncbi:hypothetical protein [Tateyamaria sp. SN3-11]|uniref:hypothetical protein n=1 Tax=Tateyamaria sp. SN3-11 TaxID=3092147 RepID=UPI0039ED357F